MKSLSQKAIREIVSEKPVTRPQLEKALDKAEVRYNPALLDGYLTQAQERWLVLDEDTGKFSIKKRAGGSGTPTKLYKVVDMKVKEVPYDKKIEDKDELSKRTPLAAVRAAKSKWYNESYFPVLEAYRALEAEHQVSEVATEGETTEAA